MKPGVLNAGLFFANLEHVPEKCKRFSDKNMLRLIELEHDLIAKPHTLLRIML